MFLKRLAVLEEVLASHGASPSSWKLLAEDPECNPKLSNPDQSMDDEGCQELCREPLEASNPVDDCAECDYLENPVDMEDEFDQTDAWAIWSDRTTRSRVPLHHKYPERYTRYDLSWDASDEAMASDSNPDEVLPITTRNQPEPGFHLFKSTKLTKSQEDDAEHMCQDDTDPLAKVSKRVSDESAAISAPGASKRPRKEDRLASNRWSSSKSKELNLSMAASAYAEDGEMELE